jgi:hypothetical protein
VVLAVLVLIGFTLAYLRFAPTFSGREGKTAPVAPGSRPEALTRQAAAMRWTPPAAPSGSQAAAAPATQATATATAVAERPAPAPAASPAPAPAPEPAEAEVAAPAPAAPQAPAPEAAAPEAPAPEAPAPAPPAAQPAPAQASHGAGMDQETFDRVLQEQLAKGVDRRVAEGRARAAGVVAARKKSQG